MSGLSVWGDTVDSLNGLGEDAVSEAPTGSSRSNRWWAG